MALYDPDIEVRREVARRVPLAISSPWQRMRTLWCASRSPNAAVERLTVLKRDADMRVRFAVAERLPLAISQAWQRTRWRPSGIWHWRG